MLSSVATDLFGAVQTGSNPVENRYDLKLEISVQPDSGTIPLAAIFHDLVKKMKSAADTDKPIAVFTATDKVFIENKVLTGNDFNKAFKVEQTEGKSSKLLLGFKVRTKHTLSEIKQRLMKPYLVPHALFLREHVGGFDDGLKVYTFGFLKNDHPDHPDLIRLQQRFEKLTTDAWKKLDAETRSTWKEDLPQAFRGDRLVVPVNFSKERISAETVGKDKVTTSAIMVTTPRKYGPLFRILMEHAILSKKITNLIPLAFSREEPESFYQLVLAQERFMDQHRNIPILNIPNDASKQLGKKGEQLDRVLYSNKFILRVSPDTKYGRYHVSTYASKYTEVHKWIKQVLQEHCFPYNPTLRPLKFSSGGPTSVKYSSVFADAVSVANESYDASTIKTTRSTPWKVRPPLDISYVPTEEAFPPLPAKKSPATATQSTTSETLDEDTMQSAISQAIKTLQEQHRAEMKKLQQDFDQQLKELENKVIDIGKQTVAQTYQALVQDDSPLATRTDHLKLQNQVDNINVQLAQIIHMLTQTSSDKNARTADFSCPFSPPRTGKRLNSNRTPEKYTQDTEFLTQSHDFTSATSDLDVGMEGCER